MPITVALDRSVDDVRPFVERARPTHPSLIDPEHRLADLYAIVNVPTVVWIDEEGRIVRPNDMQFGTDTFTAFHGQKSEPFLQAVREWVRSGRGVVPRGTLAKQQRLPTQDEQWARAEFTLAWYLHRHGRTEAAERHFLRAGELAPFDFTIRRGSMPIRGINPMGPEFFKLYEEWKAAGSPAYPRQPLEGS